MALISSSSPSEFNHGKEYSSRKVMTLPRIEHPSKSMNEDDQNSLDIRGKSRDGEGNGQLIRNERSTPDLKSRRRRSSSFKHYSNNSTYASPLTQIPENISTIYGEDREKVRLPVFGRRPESTRSSYSLSSGKSSPRTERIIVDELETVLREKVRSQIHDVKTKFRHAAHSDSTGKISREAFYHLIASIFGTQRQIGPNQIDKLLERLNLKHLNKISFDDFINCLFTGEEDLPNWVSRQSSSRDSSSRRTAAQVFLILKDKIRTKEKDLIMLCPSLEGGPSSRIFKAQFHHTLIDMGYRMNDKEFDKLWDKFDTDGFHFITSEKFVKRLTTEEYLNESPSIPTSETQDQQAAILRTSYRKSSGRNSQIETPRLNTGRSQLDENQIRRWLIYKFPHGFSELETSLERLDTQQLGILSREQFLGELKHFGLTLEGNLFDLFLKRLNIDYKSNNGSIPYRDVLNAFKEQTNSQQTLSRGENRQTALEKQVEYLISINYPRIVDQLDLLDSSHSGTMTSNQMKSLIEDLLEFPLRPDEYHQLFKRFPIDQNGKIKYKDYLKQVINRTNIQEEDEEEEEEEEKSSMIPQWDYMRSKNIRESLDQEHFQKKKREKSKNENENDQEKRRSFEQLREIIKTIIRDRYKDLEDEFQKLDRASYGELTQDLLYHLFQRLSIKPEINRSEIILLWSRCHLKENRNLDFHQFLREFGYTKQSAHYPNAKQNPPKKGDADFLLTSRKLYADTVLVHGAALNAIRSNWDQLRQEFTQLDPYRTGFIQSEEFDEILTELCPSVNQEDLDVLRTRFQTKKDLRMNYVFFLKHHAPLAQLIEEIDQPYRNSYSSNKENSAQGRSERTHFNELSNKLQRKLSDSLKELRRTFKQKDFHNSGSVPVQIFREILSQYKCPLNDEEFYTLTSQLDTKMDGTINYHYFIQQYLKNT